MTPGLDDLAAEQRALQDLLRDIEPDDWFRPTPAWGWDVRDTIGHLADTDDVAVDTMTDGPDALGKLSERSASSEDVTYRGVLRARRRSGADVLAWWEAASARERDVLSTIDQDTRIPWGLGMKPRSLVSARLMETWAHGLDVHAALGVEPVDTDRLAHVVWLATRALPYAYSVAGREPPAEPLRVELVLPSGALAVEGPDDAENRITGPASEYCRVFVQRLPRSEARGLVAQGPAAEAALDVARAYL